MNGKKSFQMVDNYKYLSVVSSIKCQIENEFGTAFFEGFRVTILGVETTGTHKNNIRENITLSFFLFSLNMKWEWISEV